jgi:hypothetical protein
MHLPIHSKILWSFLLASAIGAAHAQDMVLRDIESQSPKTLSKAEVTELLTGAKMSRVSGRGNVHYWTNDPGGKFVISSDNRGAGAVGVQGRTTTSPGTWQISDDGRYCVLIEWKGVPTEEWCRFILQTSDGYYATRSTSVGTERVYKLEIKK